jgi:hypothetical protein
MPNCYICLLQIASLVSIYMSIILCKVLSWHGICRLCMPTIASHILDLVSITVSKLLYQILCLCICQFVYLLQCYKSVCQLTYQVQYLLICQKLYLMCYVLYVGCHMPRLVCRFLYVECHVLTIASLQSSQLYAYLSTSLCMLYHRSRILALICRHMSAKYLL